MVQHKVATWVFYLFVIINAIINCGESATPVVSTQLLLPPVFRSITNNLSPSSTILAFSKLETNFELSNSYSNSFDPDIISVMATYRHEASGKLINTNCFFTQNYSSTLGDFKTSYTPGPYFWSCRFTPQLLGSWSYFLSAQDSSGTGHSSTMTFSCPGERPSFGFIKISPGSRYFISTKTNTTFFPIGENVCWWDSNPSQYQQWLTRLHASGGNYIRVWMADWSTSIEWQNTGLGNYTQRLLNAWEQDYIFDLCEKLNITIMLTMNNHGQFSAHTNPEWPQNPYNHANGGPLTQPNQLWSNSVAKMYFERRYRYILARWGYSPNLLSFEFWNEQDLTDGWNQVIPEVVAWHKHFAQYFKQNDPYQHLVTTSLCCQWDQPFTSQIWASLDYAQIHTYGQSDMYNAIGTDIPLVSSFVGNSKPVWIGEIGTGSNFANQSDPKGVYIHNTQWVSLVVSGASGGFTWWWDSYVDPFNLYHVWTGISNYMKPELNMDQYHYSSQELSIVTQQKISIFSISGGEGWGYKSAPDFTLTERGVLTPSLLSLSSFVMGASYNTQNRQPVTFHFTNRLTTPMNFSVIVVGASDAGATVTIESRGNVLTNVPVKSVKSPVMISVTVPAGSDSVTVNNTGLDWYQFSSLNFGNYVYALRSKALVGNNRILGYIQTTNWDWTTAYTPNFVPTINDAKLSFDCSAFNNKNNIVIQWWDTVTGTITHSQTGIRCSTSNPFITTVAVPQTDASHPDLAFKLYS